MSPSRQVVKTELEKIIVPELAACGFRYSPSQLKFSRKVSHVTQIIEVSLNRYNSAEYIDFWTMWGVHSTDYSRWHQQEWGEKPYNNSLGGCADWNIPGWSYPPGSYHFDLSDRRSREAVMRWFLSDIQDCGLPYLERISTWVGAAEELLNNGWMFGTAAEFFLIAGDQERAREALERGLKMVDEGRKVDSLKLLELKRKLDVKPKCV